MSHSPGRPCSRGSSWLKRQSQTPEPVGCSGQGQSGCTAKGSGLAQLCVCLTPKAEAACVVSSVAPDQDTRPPCPGLAKVAALPVDHPRVPGGPILLTLPSRHSRQSVAVLQFPGRPPAWEHWRENSAMVLHMQEAPGGHWQRSCMQACTYGSSGTRPRHSSKATAVSSFSHSARWRAHGSVGGGRGLLTPSSWLRCPGGGGLSGKISSTVSTGPPPRERLLPRPGRPVTHVLRAGLGGWHVLGVVAHLLRLADLLHVPKLDGAEEHAWGWAQLIRVGLAPGAYTQPVRGAPGTYNNSARQAPGKLTVREELRVGLQAIVVTTEAASVVPELTVQLQLSRQEEAAEWPRARRTTGQTAGGSPHGQASSEPCLNGNRLLREGWGQPGGILASLGPRKGGGGRPAHHPGPEGPALVDLWSRLCRPLTCQSSPPAWMEAAGNSQPPLDPVLPCGPGTHHERVLTVPHEAEASPGEDLRVSVILLDEQPRAVVRGGDTGGTGESHVPATQPATQPPTATHTQPPTAPGPPQSCCSEGTEACTQSGGTALPWPLSQPWGHRQLGHPRPQWLESPVHLGWTGSFGQSHTLPAHLPLSSPSSVLGRAPPAPRAPGGGRAGSTQVEASPTPAQLSPLCSPQLLPLYGLYPPRPEPDPAGGEPCWAGCT